MRTRTLLVGAAVLALAGSGAYVANRLADGGEVTEVGVERAVANLREQLPTVSTPVVSAPVEAVPFSDTPDASPAPSTAVPPAPVLPAVGVYSYATTGYDSVDVLTGARHDYPELTTITVTPEGCGVRLRWDVAAERWDTWDWCRDGDAIRLVGWTSYHEFFDVAGRSDYTCTGDPRPLDAPAGTTWTMVCRVGDTDTSTFRGTVVGPTTVEVGGTAVAALHVTYEVAVVGVSTGTQRIDGWYRTTDGLPLRETVATTTDQQTVVGTTRFEERATIELVSLTPAT